MFRFNGVFNPILKLLLHHAVGVADLGESERSHFRKSLTPNRLSIFSFGPLYLAILLDPSWLFRPYSIMSHGGGIYYRCYVNSCACDSTDCCFTPWADASY